MADPVSAAAAVATMVSSGMGAASKVMAGHAEKQKYSAQALKMQEAAAEGKVKAIQTDTAFREELGQTLANLKAIRAGQNADISSPTSLALEDRAGEVSDKRRTSAVGNLLRQANAADSDAIVLRKSGSKALTAGWLKAAPDLLSVAQAGFGLGGKAK